MGEIGIAHEGADAHAAVREMFHAVEPGRAAAATASAIVEGLM
jgi:hypothetical protein